MSDAQAILTRVANDLSAKPRLREEARAALTLFSYLELNSEEELILFLLGQCAGLQDRIDQLERARPRGMREALVDADGYLEADDAEERPDPGNIRRRLRNKIRAALSPLPGPAQQ